MMVVNHRHEVFELVVINIFQIGCCGANGANDYLEFRKPLPPECRDSVTGHTYFHGCVDELTWFLEEKAAWLAGVSMFLCLFDVSNIKFSFSSTALYQFIRKP